NTPVDLDAFDREARRILKEVEDELGWMYETTHKDGSQRRVEATVWSELFSCPQCAGEIVYLCEALDAKSKKVREHFPCPHCHALLTKDPMDRVFELTVDRKLGSARRTVKYRPCLVEYHVAGTRAEKAPDSGDIALLDRISNLRLPTLLPSDRFPIEHMYHGTTIEPKGF